MGKVKSARERSAFGQRMFKARKAAGLSIEQVAKKVGVSVSTLSQAENEGQGSALVVQFADLYGVSPWWLAVGQEPMRLASAEDLSHEALRIARQIDAIKDPANRANALAICETATISLASAPPREVETAAQDEGPATPAPATPSPAKAQRTRT